MTFHGDGYLSLGLPDVPRVTGHIYSGFGFRSSQDVGLLYLRHFPVRAPRSRQQAAWGLGGERTGVQALACSPDLATVPRMGHTRCPCSRAGWHSSCRGQR